jgi:hypothetical protein
MQTTKSRSVYCLGSYISVFGGIEMGEVRASLAFDAVSEITGVTQLAGAWWVAMDWHGC